MRKGKKLFGRCAPSQQRRSMGEGASWLRSVDGYLVTKGLECYRNQIMIAQVKVALTVSMTPQTEMWELNATGFPALKSLAYPSFHKYACIFHLYVSWLKYPFSL